MGSLTDMRLAVHTCPSSPLLALVASFPPPTWTISLGLLGIELLRAQGGSRLKLGFGELRQVGHDRVLVHVGVHNLFRGNHLGE